MHNPSYFSVLVLACSLLAGVAPAQTTAPAGQGADTAAQTDPIPPPPVPPRIAEGPQYERCLDMIGVDPAEAADFAAAWARDHQNDEGAAHCSALAQLALGQTALAALALEHLAVTSHAAPGPRAALYAQAGQAWLLANDPLRAFGSATMALSLTPDDPNLLIDRAVAAGSGGEYRAAIDDLTRALELDPSRGDALVLRATSWRHLEQPSRAEDDITLALQQDPENAEALLERGILRQIKGDPVGAREDWERTIALDPDSPTADFARQNIALLEAGPNQNETAQTPPAPAR